MTTTARALAAVVTAAAATLPAVPGVAAVPATPPSASARAALPQAVQDLRWPVVRRGASGQPVRTLQYLLRARGGAVAVDGAFGRDTDRAVRAFQRSHGLAIDGVVGPRTWRALLVTVQQGSRGDAVRAVQDQFQ